jgi:rSAM/selenodomain-associated transferase 2
VGCHTSSEQPLVSVVIPACNEVVNLRRLLPQLAALDPRPEVIVAEAGSADETRSVALALGALVASSAPGRGPQLVAGAQLAQGAVLLFVHADSSLCQSSWNALHKALADPNLEGGAFRFSLEGTPGIWPRLYEFFVDLRSRWLGLPYGDQGYFARRAAWERVGPFLAIPIMEDVQWWTRLRRQAKVKILPAPLVTSPRRFQRRGWLSSSVRNLSLLAAWKMGVSPERILSWYR